MEVGQHSPWISRILGELGHEVLVANPRKVRAIYTNTRKSDQNDAHMLARIARVDPNCCIRSSTPPRRPARPAPGQAARQPRAPARGHHSAIRFTLKSWE